MTISSLTSDDATPRARWAAQVMTALRTLSATERGVLYLSYSAARLTQPEIATLMDISLAQVRKNAASGLQRLGAALIAPAV